MSAFLCSDELIVKIAIICKVKLPYAYSNNLNDFFSNLNNNEILKLSNSLLRQNLKSVNVRYANDKVKFFPIELKTVLKAKKQLFEAYSNDKEKREKFIIQQIKNIDCFCYQSCEYSGFNRSNNYRLLQKTKLKLCNGLFETSKIYDSASWG